MAMTDAQIKEYYANLLILQYRGQTKASETIKVQVDPVIMNQLPQAVNDAFDLDTAVGNQLDVLGKYIGISREGFNFSGPVTLTDDQYRQALKIKIIQNNSGSSLYDIQQFLHIFFENQIFVFDYLGMRISYFIDTDVGDESLAEFFIVQELLPKPMAVQLSATIYGPDLTSFFGFRTYSHIGINNSPLNTYEDYQLDYPFLTYEDALIP